MTVSIKMLVHGVAVSSPDTGEVQQVALVEGVPGFPTYTKPWHFLQYTAYTTFVDLHVIWLRTLYVLPSALVNGSDDVGTDSAPLGSTWYTRATLVEELLVVLLMNQNVLKVAVTPKCDDGNFRKHLSHPV